VSSNIKGLNVFFYNRWAHFCEIKQRWVPFLLGFSEILPRLLTNQTFLGCACTPAQPTPTPLRYTALRNIKTTASRITNFKPRIKIVKACVFFSVFDIVWDAGQPSDSVVWVSCLVVFGRVVLF